MVVTSFHISGTSSWIPESPDITEIKGTVSAILSVYLHAKIAMPDLHRYPKSFVWSSINWNNSFFFYLKIYTFAVSVQKWLAHFLFIRSNVSWNCAYRQSQKSKSRLFCICIYNAYHIWNSLNTYYLPIFVPRVHTPFLK